MSAPLIVPAIKKHSATVLFVHGLGDSGHGLLPIARRLRQDPALQHIKWILPHAQERPVTANHGLSMPAWFDLYDFSFKGPEDREGMLESAGVLNAIIQKEIDDTHLDSNRIVLGGFSQGGAMSLLTGLTYPSKLGGLIVLSGLLHIHNEVKGMLAPHAASLPIFWGHGEDDLLVPHSIAQQSVEYLTKDIALSTQERIGGPGLKIVSYTGLEHSTSEKELDDVTEFLKCVIPDIELS
ncbi:hypothetical protein ID866_9512 [Astraeus odoratus]|nr:hypothetical protein ID866_9512 [Astraeus odoratus]